MENPSIAASEGAVFPFMKLPPELRLKVYKLTLVCDEPLKIRDLRPDDFERQCNAGHLQRRMRYVMSDIRWRKYWHTSSYASCAWIKPSLVSYDLARSEPGQDPVVAVLSLDRLTREEALPVFYTMNTFHFLSWNSLIPFLSDRTARSHELIQSIILVLTVSTTNVRSKRNEWVQEHACWSQIFDQLAQFDRLNTKSLSLLVEGTEEDINGLRSGDDDDAFSPVYQLQWWTSFCDYFAGQLDFFGIKYFHRRSTWKLAAWLSYFPNDAINELIEDDMWNIAALTVLKLDGKREHTGATLQDRRILEDYSTEDWYPRAHPGTNTGPEMPIEPFYFSELSTSDMESSGSDSSRAASSSDRESSDGETLDGDSDGDSAESDSLDTRSSDAESSSENAGSSASIDSRSTQEILGDDSGSVSSNRLSSESSQVETDSSGSQADSQSMSSAENGVTDGSGVSESSSNESSGSEDSDDSGISQPRTGAQNHSCTAS